MLRWGAVRHTEIKHDQMDIPLLDFFEPVVLFSTLTIETDTKIIGSEDEKTGWVI